MKSVAQYKELILLFLAALCITTLVSNKTFRFLDIFIVVSYLSLSLLAGVRWSMHIVNMYAESILLVGALYYIGVSNIEICIYVAMLVVLLCNTKKLVSYSKVKFVKDFVVSFVWYNTAWLIFFTQVRGMALVSWIVVCATICLYYNTFAEGVKEN